MNRPTGLLFLSLALLLLVTPATAQNQVARGFVFEDTNKNRTRDEYERGIPGIRVSNGVEIVKTAADGSYEIPVGEDTILFVIKPRNWMTPLNDRMIPQFFYIHKPAGSPQFKYPGVPPTGPLPASVDFPLYRSDEPKKFEALMFGDPQPRNLREIDYIAHDVVEDLLGTDAAFGVSLGDIMFDNLEHFDALNQVIAMIGIPWYNVLGNHDINYDAPNDRQSDETFESVYGPSYYSFDYGPTHFIVVDDVEWIAATETTKGEYKAGLGDEQLAFIKNDLALVPESQLVVFMMHIPLSNDWIQEDRDALYRMMEARPFCFSISAHAHWMAHRFITTKDGWRKPEPHHHLINVTVCGSWWTGDPDERGIPHTLMKCGAPNGHTIMTFDGNQYSIRFKAAGRPENYQMNIYAPDEVKVATATETDVLVNVFFGSERSKVEMRIGALGEWVTMTPSGKVDPQYAEMKRLEAEKPPVSPYRKLPDPMNSPHLWEAKLPAGIPVGTHLIRVRTTDMFGQVYEDSRILRVVE